MEKMTIAWNAWAEIRKVDHEFTIADMLKKNGFDTEKKIAIMEVSEGVQYSHKG